MGERTAASISANSYGYTVLVSHCWLVFAPWGFDNWFAVLLAELLVWSAFRGSVKEGSGLGSNRRELKYSSVDQLIRQCRSCNGSNLTNNTNCTEADPVAEAIALK